MRAYRSSSLVVLVALLVGSLAACASRGPVVSRYDVQKPWSVQEATVIQVSEATIEGRETAIGTFGGGGIGYSLGHAVGHGAGSSIAGAMGAVAGAIVGQKAEKAATQRKAWEILVDVESGVETLSIIQPADETFTVGEKVRLYTRSDGSARVAKL